MKSFFKTLLLEEKYDISKEELEVNYNNLIVRYHPDNFENPQDVLNNTQIIFDINEAYEIILDDIKRARYFLKINNFDIENIKLDNNKMEEIFDLTEKYYEDKNGRFIEEKINILQEKLLNLLKNNEFQDGSKILLEILYLQGIIKHSL